jgi:hypothetical protein
MWQNDRSAQSCTEVPITITRYIVEKLSISNNSLVIVGMRIRKIIEDIRFKRVLLCV